MDSRSMLQRTRDQINLRQEKLARSVRSLHRVSAIAVACSHERTVSEIYSIRLGQQESTHNTSVDEAVP